MLSYIDPCLKCCRESAFSMIHLGDITKDESVQEVRESVIITLILKRMIKHSELCDA